MSRKIFRFGFVMDLTSFRTCTRRVYGKNGKEMLFASPSVF